MLQTMPKAIAQEVWVIHWSSQMVRDYQIDDTDLFLQVKFLSMLWFVWILDLG